MNNNELLNLERAMDSEEFIALTYLQIKKDATGLIDLSDEFAPALDSPKSSLEDLILTIIHELVNSTPEMLSQFIYRVDLKESIYLNSLANRDFQSLSHEILKREALKVFLRTKFS